VVPRTAGDRWSPRRDPISRRLWQGVAGRLSCEAMTGAAPKASRMGGGRGRASSRGGRQAALVLWGCPPTSRLRGGCPAGGAASRRHRGIKGVTGGRWGIGDRAPHFTSAGSVPNRPRSLPPAVPIASGGPRALAAACADDIARAATTSQRLRHARSGHCLRPRPPAGRGAAVRRRPCAVERGAATSPAWRRRCARWGHGRGAYRHLRRAVSLWPAPRRLRFVNSLLWSLAAPSPPPQRLAPLQWRPPHQVR